MKIRASDSDFLQKSDGTSWLSCKVQTPSVGTSGLGITDYLSAGKNYSAPTWFIWQTFLRFDTSVIRQSHNIDSATLRLYIETDGSDTDFTLTAIVLDTSYETCDATDWVTTYAGVPYTTLVIEDAAIRSDSDGDYIEIPFTEAMIAAIAKDGNTELVLRANEVSEPTNGQYIKCYSHQYATAALRPRLDVVTKGLRQQMYEALKTSLDTIAELDGYATTANVEINFKGMAAVTTPNVPAIYILTDDETRVRESYQVDLTHWNPHLLLIVRNPDRTGLTESLNALIDDVEHCLGRHYPTLGLSGGVQLVRLETVETHDTLTIDDNYAVALVRLDVEYLAHVNEP